MATNTGLEPAKSFRKKWKIAILVLAFLVGLGLAAGFYGISYYQQTLKPVKAIADDQKIIIPQGASTIRIANILLANDLIQDINIFRLYTMLNNLDGKIKAGEYILNASMSTPEIIDKIVAGTIAKYPFTIPEGYTLKQMAKTLSNKGLVNETVFLELLEQGEFNFPYQDQLLTGANRFEGFLFPDTYYITSSMTEKDIIQMMLNRFLQVVTPEVAAEAAAKNLSIRELITLASMIERESSVDADRSKIAGVMFNRLAKGMLLQIDATVIYAHGEHFSRVLKEHLQIDSPYNTYKYPGLPLGPIAAPGEKSIKAVLEPAQHKYYYYVLKPDGSHYFSSTLTEHNQAAQKYLPNR